MKTIGPPRWRTILTATLLLITIFPFVWWGLLRLWYNGSISSPETAPAERVAVVFGARVYPSGRLSGMLRDRVDTAVQLYHAGAVQKLLLSGDNRFEDYNEPQAMMAYAIARGVPAEDIQPDYGGRRTYDTCYRAREIFQLESALLITQNFHLPRALFTCQRLGLAVTAVAADRNRYSRRSLAWSTAREIPAALLAFLDVIQRRPAPVLGEPISID